MKPIFWIWKWPVTPYSLLMMLGIFIGFAIFAWFGGKRWGIDKALDAIIWGMIGGLVLGRLGFVVANWEYFSDNFKETWQLWKGGIAFSTALVGGLITLSLFAHFQRLNLMELLDLASLSLAPAQALGWWACHIAGFAYGKEWKGFLSFFLPDVYGVKAYRFPSQATGAIWSILLSILLLILYLKTRRSGDVFLAYILGYLPFDFSLRFLRGDIAKILGLLEPGQLVLICLFVFSLLLYFIYPRSSLER